ncbi:hypothetical protein [Moraxella bovis]|uniref:hypothetical protein n=1 Tax=Moraxella bovis TaxID=476 RepID=UPI00227CF1BA|nr:hypothetical protein [Moraxella bovis]WAJ74553.1 hypothetical protein LP095_05225 [Moraxella bovis]WAJ74806.1 hypothetical protein LP095_06585 [Moraxella bovis]
MSDQKPAPYLSLQHSDRPNARFGEVELFLTCQRFSDDEKALKGSHEYATDGYAIVTSAGYLLFERVSDSTFRFIGFTTVTPKKTDKRYAIFDQEGYYGRFLGNKIP